MKELNKIAEQIFLECEKDGEPVSWEEALEMAKMELKAKGIKRYERSEVENSKKQDKKRPTVKVSAQKQQLFNDILTFLNENYENVEVLTKNKLISVQIDDKNFKLDLIQSRK